MKKRLQLLILVLISQTILYGQGSENFNALNIDSSESNADGSFVGQTGDTWFYESARDGQDYGAVGSSIMLRGQNEGSLTSSNISGGITNLSFRLTNAFDSNVYGVAYVQVYIKKSTDTNYTLIKTTSQVGTADRDAPKAVVISDINVSGEFSIKIVAKEQPIVLDDVTWYVLGQKTEDFELLNIDISESDVNGSFAGTSGDIWNYERARDGGVYGVSGKSIMLRGQDDGSITSNTISGGISNLSFQLTNAYDNTGNEIAYVQVYIRGEGDPNYNLVRTTSPVGTSNSGSPKTVIISDINVPGDFSIRIVARERPIVVDNIQWSVQGQNIEDFDSLDIDVSEVNVDGSFTGVAGVIWNYGSARDGQSYGVAGKSIMLRGQDNARITSSNIIGGISNLSFQLTNAFDSATNETAYVLVYVKGKDDTSYNLVKTTSPVGTADSSSPRTIIVPDINILGDFSVRIIAKGRPIVVDNIKWYGYGEKIENFNLLNIASSAVDVDGSFVGTTGDTWNYESAGDGKLYGASGRSIMLRGQEDGSITSDDISGGITNLYFQLTTANDLPENETAYVEVYAKGTGDANYSLIETTSPVGTANGGVQNIYVNDINIIGDFSIRIVAKERPIVLDNIRWSAQGQEIEDFELLNIDVSESDVNGSFVGTTGDTWDYERARDGGIYGVAGKSIMLRGQDNGRITSETISGGISNLSFQLTNAYDNAGNEVAYVQVYVKGIGDSSYRLIKTTSPVGTANSSAPRTITVSDINVSGDFSLRIVGKERPIVLDNIQWYGYDNVSVLSYMPAKVSPKYPFANRTTTSLNGVWKFEYDAAEVGQFQKWYVPGNKTFTVDYTVPGSTHASGIFQDRFYNSVGTRSIKSQTRNFKNSWCTTTFSTPSYSSEERVWLKFGGVHPAANIYVNGIFVGYHEQPNISVKYDVTELLKSGETNELVVEFNEELIARAGGGHFNQSVYWTGIFRAVELEVANSTTVQNVIIKTDITTGNVALETDLLAQDAGFTGLIQAVFTNLQTNQTTTFASAVNLQSGENLVNTDYTLNGIQLWTPENPNLYSCEVRVLDNNQNVLDSRKEDFGFREFTTVGGEMYLNGDYLYLRGCGTLNVYPESVSPPTDREQYRQEILQWKEFGFNHIRHHSFMPTDEYLEVANEEGILVQAGAVVHGLWAGYRADYYIPDAYRKTKWTNLLKGSMNHPSLFTYCMGNEESVSGGVTDDLRQISDSLDVDQFVMVTAHLETDWSNERSDIIETNLTYTDKPWFRHEYSHSSSNPDPTKQGLYTGYSANGSMWYLDRMIDNAATNGTSDRLADWAEYSRLYQVMNQKSSIEFFRLSKQNADGYSFWMGQDSYYTMGVVDNFGNAKTPPSGFKKFNDKYALLNKDDVDPNNNGGYASFGTDEVNLRQRVLASNGVLNTTLVLQNSSYNNITTGTGSWTLTNVTDGIPVAQGSFSNVTCASGAYEDLAVLGINIPDYTRAKRLQLSVSFTTNGESTTNDWYYMVFPTSQSVAASVYFDASIPSAIKTEIIANFPNLNEISNANNLPNKGVFLSADVNANTEDALRNGHNVFLLSLGVLDGFLKNLGESRDRIPLKWATFLLGSNYFNNDQVFGNVVRNTDILGSDFTYSDASKPFVDNVVVNPFLYAEIMNLSPYPENSFDNLIEAIPYFRNVGKISYAMQSKLTDNGNEASLLASSFNFNLADLDSRDVFARMLEYMVSNNFDPTNGMAVDDFVDSVVTETMVASKVSPERIIEVLELDNTNTSQVSLYPSPVPAGENFSIDLSFGDHIGQTEIYIYSLSGQLVQSRQAAQHDSEMKITNMAPSSPGLYFVKIKNGKTVRVGKLVVK